jgi:hypothetical protein
VYHLLAVHITHDYLFLLCACFFTVKAAPGVIVKLMGCYLALAVLGLMVLLVLLENISSSSKKDDADCPDSGITVDSIKMSFQVARLFVFFVHRIDPCRICFAANRSMHHIDQRLRENELKMY